MARHDEGYTLVELIVVILIFLTVMTLISVSFNRIVASSGQIAKSAETDIGGLIGLEVLRCDLELAGFGLPWSLPSGVTYEEAGNYVLVAGCPDNCPQANASFFNDAPSDAPRAYLVGNNAGYNGSDYLVLKGTALGMSEVSRSWSYLNYTSNGVIVKPSKYKVELTLGKSDKVIVIKSGVAAGEATRELVSDGIGRGCFGLVFDDPSSDDFRPFHPKCREDNYLVYGVARADSPDLTFPFNRADYYISRTGSISPICAPHTGVLYKTTINQDGKPTYYPLLDCVADMQVVFHTDNNGDGEADFHQSDNLAAAGDLRERLKEVRVHILAQQGKKDPGYSYPVQDPGRAIFVGAAGLDPSLGRIWTQSALSERFGAEWRNYRWKLYSVVVQPKNL